jgi:hypothetical protein
MMNVFVSKAYGVAKPPLSLSKLYFMSPREDFLL